MHEIRCAFTASSRSLTVLETWQEQVANTPQVWGGLRMHRHHMSLPGPIDLVETSGVATHGRDVLMNTCNKEVSKRYMLEVLATEIHYLQPFPIFIKHRYCDFHIFGRGFVASVKVALEQCDIYIIPYITCKVWPNVRLAMYLSANKQVYKACSTNVYNVWEKNATGL